MGLVLLTKGSQCFMGPVFTPFDSPAFVITGIVNDNGCDSESLKANMQLTHAIFNV